MSGVTLGFWGYDDGLALTPRGTQSNFEQKNQRSKLSKLRTPTQRHRPLTWDKIASSRIKASPSKP